MAINLLTPDGNGNCPTMCCHLPDSGCLLTFTYTNVNLVQDDAFDIQLQKQDGTWVTAGNINGACTSYCPGGDDLCDCCIEDVKHFDYTITNDLLGVDGCNPCAIKFQCIMTADNGCGTYATFDITGPYGTGFGGYLGDSGSIDISVSCISP